MDKRQIIKDSIFFSNLSADEIATIAASSTIKEFANDEVIPLSAYNDWTLAP